MKRQPSPVPLPCYFFNVQTCEYQVEDLADPCNVGEVFMREDVERLLAAAPQPQTEQAPPAAVPAGYALAPAEPTEKMIDAAQGEAVYFTELPSGEYVQTKDDSLKEKGYRVVTAYLAPQAPPDLVTQLDHARRRIGQLTIQLGEVMKAPPAAVPAVPADYTLGETIYTPPSEEVRFCYSRGQPNNVNASRLGEACRRAAEKPGGDYIDGGLSLLKQLEARGYGVFRFAKSGHEQAQPAALSTPAAWATDAPEAKDRTQQAPPAAVPAGYVLAQQWREQAENLGRSRGTWNGSDLADRIDRMADELEAMLAAAPQPQASAEDVALVNKAVSRWPRLEAHAAWQRIRADYERMGVVK